MDAYRDKGRVSPILDNVPLFAVMTEDLGVRGAIKSAQLEYERFFARNGGIVDGTTEKEGKTHMDLFHLSVAFCLGALVGVHVLARQR
jgi:glucokinase